MADTHAVTAEFLAEDLAEIRRLVPSDMPEADGLAQVLREALGAYRRDEAAWQAVEHQHDAASATAQVELKRRETSGLLVSMRSRTIRSEMEMHEFRERVRGLEERHTQRRAQARVLQQSLARLRRQIQQAQDRPSQAGGTSAAPGRRVSRLHSRLAAFWRGHD